MSVNVGTALVQTYKSNIEVQFQQKGSRLRSTVRNEVQNAEYDFYDRIGPTSAVEVTNRHGDTPLISTTHDRRRCHMKDYDWADLIDRPDRIRMLADPTSPYTMNAVYAMGRQMDARIISEATGTAYTGKTGSTSTTYPSASQIAVDYVESGSTANSNMTIAKLRRARYLLEQAEAIEDGDQVTCAITASQKQALLRSTEMTNSDYNTVRALVNGEINTFMGFTFVQTELLAKSGDNRTCLIYPSSGITLAVGSDIMVDVGPRRDKRNSQQIYVCASFGAVRMWEEKVISVLCDETA